MVDVVGEVVEARVADLDLELALARLLHHVAQLVRQLARDAAELAHLVLRAERHPPRREALRDQPARVRAGDLEDVEVRDRARRPTAPRVAIALSRVTNRLGSRRLSE